MPLRFNLAKYPNNIFIETGTYKGDGVQAALNAGFKKIYSIEVFKDFYDISCKRFEKEIAEGKVKLFLGDSIFYFKNMLKDIKEPATIWLDAHSHAGGVGDKPCSLYEELDGILDGGIKDHIIIIDDRRMFKSWGIDEKIIRQKLFAINPSYNIFYEKGFTDEDIIVAVTKEWLKQDLEKKKVYISLTTISSRIEKVKKVIDSILNQTVHADGIKLYISKEAFLFDSGINENDIPYDLRLLCEQGLLEIVYTKNIGPYRKLIPILKEKFLEDCIIITADDDTCYPKDWIEKFLSVSLNYPNSIVSFRNRYVEFNHEDPNILKQYKLWPEINKIFYSKNYWRLNPKRIFPTGKGGILYKPSFFDQKVFDQKFLDICPCNDDIWFKMVTLASGVGGAIAFSDFHNFDFKNIPDESQINLYKINFDERSSTYNDIQIHKISRYLKEKYEVDAFKVLQEAKDYKGNESPDKFIKNLPGELWGITTFFNPAGYKNKYENYKVFRESSKKQGLKLLAVELAFDSMPFTLNKGDADLVIQIRGNKNNIMWQKEALLNIGLKKLPINCDKFVWVDCDVIFQNNNWVKETAELLEQYNIVQPYALSILMDKNGNPKTKDAESERFGVAYTRKNLNSRNGHPGFAWAARRSIFDDIGFYDKLIIGSADVVISDAFYSPFITVKDECSSYAMILDLAGWWKKCYDLVRGSVYYCDGTVLHLWHGEVKNRQYIERRYVLKQDNFNPQKDIKKNRFGIWQWSCDKKHLINNIKMYFFLRNEENLYLFGYLHYYLSIIIDRSFVSRFVKNLNNKKDRFLGLVGIVLKKISPKLYAYLVDRKPKWMQPLDM